MKRVRNILLFFLLTLAILAGVGVLVLKNFTFKLEAWDPLTETTPPQAIPDRPNILLLVAEDMSDRVGAFGDALAHTPNIDELAKTGVRYPNTFTTAGVCSPSRAALITGMHQISMGGQHMRTSTRPEGAYQCVPPAEVKAFPELLRKAGYFTFNTAKQDYQFSGAMPGSGPFTIWDEENDPNLWRSRQVGQPFFGMMNFMETHESGIFSPLGEKPNSAIHFVMQLMRSVSTDAPGTSINPKDIKLPPYFPDTPTIRKDIARHYENIAAMDAIVGDILAKLKNDGLLEHTIVIWTTDHGDGLPRSKRELYDTGIKVPMVIYYPEAFRPEGFVPGSVDQRLISFIDFAPTFLRLAKAPVPDFIQGQDFMSNDSASLRDYVYASRDRIDEVYDRQRAVRDHRYKYIRSWYPEQEGGHPLAFRDNLNMMRELWKLKEQNALNEEQLLWFQAPGEERLFDTKADPFELHDLSEDTAFSGTLTRLRASMDDWLSSIEDWSEVPENEMVERFEPNGHTEKTPAPEIQEANNTLIITASEGASIGYQLGEGAWRLYSEPIPVTDLTSLRAKAVRYGWEESEEVVFEKK